MFQSLVPSQTRGVLDVHDVVLNDTATEHESNVNSEYSVKEEYLTEPLRSAFRRALGPEIHLPLRAKISNQLVLGNKSFTSISRHKGNSGIFRVNSDIPFYIEKIVEFDEKSIQQYPPLKGEWMAGRALKASTVEQDPYLNYPLLRAKLWGTELEANVEVWPIDQVEGHFAQLLISWEGQNASVVLSLSRVSLVLLNIREVY
ncbi:hypothetical protein H0H93_012248 [Arthromyces matolae]|nr:hypothetical protein H0H93_012248 [Arthromyces matolae]